MSVDAIASEHTVKQIASWASDNEVVIVFSEDRVVVAFSAQFIVTGPAIEATDEFLDRMLLVNVRGTDAGGREAARRMSAGGVIVNMVSTTGFKAAVGISAYVTSKHAVVGATKALALEWARYGIRVNALAPGYFATELNDDFFGSDAGKALIKRIPQRRLGQLAELDGPLLLLISGAGSFMTGSAWREQLKPP